MLCVDSGTPVVINSPHRQQPRIAPRRRSTPDSDAIVPPRSLLAVALLTPCGLDIARHTRLVAVSVAYVLSLSLSLSWFRGEG